MSSSVSPQFNHIILIPAFRAAGIPLSRRRRPALFPAPSDGRPIQGDRKKFCMSTITRAVNFGDTRTSDVVVASLIEESGAGTANSGGLGRVRSKVGGE